MKALLARDINEGCVASIIQDNGTARRVDDKTQVLHPFSQRLGNPQEDLTRLLTKTDNPFHGIRELGFCCYGVTSEKIATHYIELYQQSFHYAERVQDVLSAIDDEMAGCLRRLFAKQSYLSYANSRLDWRLFGFIAELAFARLLELGAIGFGSVLGEGAGELTAACLAGAIDISDAIRLLIQQQTASEVSLRLVSCTTPLYLLSVGDWLSCEASTKAGTGARAKAQTHIEVLFHNIQTPLERLDLVAIYQQLNQQSAALVAPNAIVSFANDYLFQEQAITEVDLLGLPVPPTLNDIAARLYAMFGYWWLAGNQMKRHEGGMPANVAKQSTPSPVKITPNNTTIFKLQGKQSKGGISSPLIMLQRGTDRQKAPIFLVHSAVGGLLQFTHIIASLGKSFTVYSFECTELVAFHTINAMAKHFVDALLDQFPKHNTFLLGGHSIAGLVAVEMSHELKKRSKQVSPLVLIDTPAPVHLPNQNVTFSDILRQWCGADCTKLDETYMRLLSDDAQIAYLRHKIGELNWQRYFHDVSASYIRGFKRQLDLLCTHQFKPLHCDILYFAANQTIPLFPANMYLAWQELNKENMHLVEINGNHITMIGPSGAGAIARAIEALAFAGV